MYDKFVSICPPCRKNCNWNQFYEANVRRTLLLPSSGILFNRNASYIIPAYSHKNLAGAMPSKLTVYLVHHFNPRIKTIFDCRLRYFADSDEINMHWSTQESNDNLFFLALCLRTSFAIRVYKMGLNKFHSEAKHNFSFNSASCTSCSFCYPLARPPPAVNFFGFVDSGSIAIVVIIAAALRQMTAKPKSHTW